MHMDVLDRDKVREHGNLRPQRPGARLFADELLGRAIESARRTASGIQGARGRSDNNTGVLAVHNLGIESDQASRGRLRRYQWSWKQWRWQDLPLRRYLPRECLCKPDAV